MREWFDKTAYDRRQDALTQVEHFGGLDALPFEEQALATAPELPRIPGVVAEELEEAGLGQFCSYDERGELVGVTYDRLPLLLIPIVREQREQITELVARLDELEGRLSRKEISSGN